MEHAGQLGYLERKGDTGQYHALKLGNDAVHWPRTTYTPAFGQDEQRERVVRPLVLVIDNSLTVRKILEICLGRVGYEVMSFEDGVQALRWLVSPQGRVPDLACVDIGLPRMDGYEVIRYLRSKPGFEHTVFVIISRRDGMLDRLKGRLAGAKAYLSKPFKTAEVVAVVGELLAWQCALQAHACSQTR